MNIKSLISFGAAAIAALTIVSCSGKNNGVTETAEAAEAAGSNVLEKVAEVPAVTVLQAGELVPPADGKPIILDFNAVWCGPCRQFAPIFDSVAEKYRGKASFYSIDVDKNPRLAAEYNVQSIPTVVYIATDGTTSTTIGLIPSNEFDARVAALIK